jgi:hypothetical protein
MGVGRFRAYRFPYVDLLSCTWWRGRADAGVPFKEPMIGADLNGPRPRPPSGGGGSTWRRRKFLS